VRAPTANIDVDAVAAGADDAALAARRAEVKRMVLRASESDDGAVEWACWYFKQESKISDDLSRWPSEPKASLFNKKGRRRQPEDGELTLDPSDQTAIWECLEERHAVWDWPEWPPIPWAPWKPATRGRGNPSSDYALRDHAIRGAARFLKLKLIGGYHATRNAATANDKRGEEFLKLIGCNATRNGPTADHKRGESAASIIAQALRRLGIKMSERTIEDILRTRRRKKP
jgi:hypothetical protein